MKLKSFRVTNFQSVMDSGDIDAGEITCLVGKNEAGKSAILKALYRLNPIRAGDGKFDAVDDYPTGGFRHEAHSHLLFRILPYRDFEPGHHSCAKCFSGNAKID